MPYRHILVPLDGSLLAEYILPHVSELARAHGSRVTLAHVISEGGSVTTELTPSQRERRARITSYLTELSGRLEQEGLEIRWELRQGDPVTALLDYVKRESVDLVVMSTHGQGATYTRRVGSVAAALLEGMSVPVLLVRVPESIARL